MQLGSPRNLQILVYFPADMSLVMDPLKLANLRKLELSEPKYFNKLAKSFKTWGTTLSCLQILSLKNTSKGFIREIKL